MPKGRTRRKKNGQFNGSVSLNLGKTHVPTASKRISMIAAVAGVVATTMAVTGCASTPKALVTTVPVKCVSIPPAGYSNITSTKLPKLFNPLPTLSGEALDLFGGQECAQTAFTYGFAFIHKANKIPLLWTPNMAKDPTFIPRLEKELAALAPYLGGKYKENFLKSIPALANPIKDETNRELASNFKGQLMMLPERLPDGTLASKGGDTYDLVAPWTLGSNVDVSKVEIVTHPDFGKTNLLHLEMTWTSRLVFGDKTGIKAHSDLKMTKSIYLMANPDSKKDKAHPYLVVNVANVGDPKWGKLVPYVKPLVEPAPK